MNNFKNFKKCKIADCQKPTKKGGICDYHKKLKLKNQHPVLYFFRAFRNNNRLKGFKITFEEFENFIVLKCFELKIDVATILKDYYFRKINVAVDFTFENLQIIKRYEI